MGKNIGIAANGNGYSVNTFMLLIGLLIAAAVIYTLGKNAQL